MHRLLGAVALSLGVLTIAPTGCSSNDPADSAPLEQVAPTKADIERDSGLVFPPSTADFRTVRMSASQIDIVFSMSAGDVATFTKASNLTLVKDRRAIVHASPLWELNDKGSKQGGTDVTGQIQRNVEVIADGSKARARISLVVASAAENS